MSQSRRWAQFLSGKPSYGEKIISNVFTLFSEATSSQEGGVTDEATEGFKGDSEETQCVCI